MLHPIHKLLSWPGFSETMPRKHPQVPHLEKGTSLRKSAIQTWTVCNNGRQLLPSTLKCKRPRRSGEELERLYKVGDIFNVDLVNHQHWCHMLPPVLDPALTVYCIQAVSLVTRQTTRLCGIHFLKLFLISMRLRTAECSL